MNCSSKREYTMSLIKDLLEKPTPLSVASSYTASNGLLYLGMGLTLTAPGSSSAIQKYSGTGRPLGMRQRSSAWSG